MKDNEHDKETKNGQSFNIADTGIYADIHRHITVEKRESLFIVRFVQRRLIDFHEAAQIEKEIMELIDQGNYKILISFAHTEALSSAFLTVLANIHKKLDDMPGGALRLCEISARIISLFTMTSADQKFHIYPTETAAIDSFRKM